MNMIGAVVSNSLIAYPFARLRFRGRNILFIVLLGTLLLPAPVLLIPQFLLFFNIGWYGTYLPLIVPSFTGNAFFVFLLRQYMRTIPRELDEAARIDGAGYFTVYRRIILPLTTPGPDGRRGVHVPRHLERLLRPVDLPPGSGDVHGRRGAGHAGQPGRASSGTS